MHYAEVRVRESRLLQGPDVDVHPALAHAVFCGGAAHLDPFGLQSSFGQVRDKHAGGTANVEESAAGAEFAFEILEIDILQSEVHQMHESPLVLDLVVEILPAVSGDKVLGHGLRVLKQERTPAALDERESIAVPAPSMIEKSAQRAGYLPQLLIVG